MTTNTNTNTTTRIQKVNGRIERLEAKLAAMRLEARRITLSTEAKVQEREDKAIRKLFAARAKAEEARQAQALEDRQADFDRAYPDTTTSRRDRAKELAQAIRATRRAWREEAKAIEAQEKEARKLARKANKETRDRAKAQEKEASREAQAQIVYVEIVKRVEAKNVRILQISTVLKAPTCQGKARQALLKEGMKLIGERDALKRKLAS